MSDYPVVTQFRRTQSRNPDSKKKMILLRSANVHDKGETNISDIMAVFCLFIQSIL